ncbi:hypothetical protein, conserved [Eimeria tenella]|uniref:Uncharacterized protein n=1 Tax=Eimeria tenella TaxID=5802 RepID=U6L2P0_EIMTE|nr:hypothetical protein, conserved [Eimeria tenella]CDJ42889.1 hypothetical protein, conserved [Eimeria tenella]|eukprot:XP_013233639.1 hypothetical protein, conserved [Eimeria tenella]
MLPSCCVAPSGAAAAAAPTSSDTSSSSSTSTSSSSSSSSSIPPLQHALVGWSTLWQFPPPRSVPRSLALAVTRELAAVLALLQSAAAAPAAAAAAASPAAAAAAAALPRLLQLAEGGPFKKEIEDFLAALQIRIQASFDKAVGELSLEALHATAAAAAAAAAAEEKGPQIGAKLPSMAQLEERIKLQQELKTLKSQEEVSKQNVQQHKLLIERLKAELQCVDVALKQITEKEEALKQGMAVAGSASL